MAGLVSDAERIKDGEKFPNWKANTLGLIQQLDGNMANLFAVRGKYSTTADLAEIDAIIADVKSAMVTMWNKYK